jgi:hypothetical protein
MPKSKGWYSDEDDAYSDIDEQHLIEYYMNHLAANQQPTVHIGMQRRLR